MFSGTEPWILVTSTSSVSSSMIHIPNILRPSNSPVFATWSKLYIGASTRSLRRGRRSKITYHFFTRQPSDGAQLPPSAMVRAGMGWDNRRHPPLHLAPPSPAGLFHASVSTSSSTWTVGMSSELGCELSGTMRSTVPACTVSPTLKAMPCCPVSTVFPRAHSHCGWNMNFFLSGAKRLVPFQ